MLPIIDQNIISKVTCNLHHNSQVIFFTNESAHKFFPLLMLESKLSLDSDIVHCSMWVLCKYSYAKKIFNTYIYINTAKKKHFQYKKCLQAEHLQSNTVRCNGKVTYCNTLLFKTRFYIATNYILKKHSPTLNNMTSFTAWRKSKDNHAVVFHKHDSI